ncbi:MAG: GIY-YIG nuclease family protein [Ignavibacteriae bacterium]|nr:GIY-YIG nuclease family protein [Ignavibacteriota bacterium]
MKKSYVYILSNYTRSTLYIGVTSNLGLRLQQHQEGGSEFTKMYNVKYLLYFEEFANIQDAIAREKQLKNWHRDWKLNLIKTVNPELKDLSRDIPWF